jgi:hypothetical protein
MKRGFRDADIAAIVEEAKKLWPDVDFKNDKVSVCPVPVWPWVSEKLPSGEVVEVDLHRHGPYVFGYNAQSRTLYVAFEHESSGPVVIFP